MCAVSLFCAAGQGKLPGLMLIPGGRFEMGDHHGFVDPKHGGGETLHASLAFDRPLS